MLRTRTALVALLVAAALLVAGLARRPAPDSLVGVVDRSPGALAYRRACSTCHPAFDPRVHAKTEWRSIVQSMHQRATEREIKVDANALEEAIRYLEERGR